MRRARREYAVIVNGMPDFDLIPKSLLAAVASKFYENLLKIIHSENAEDKDGQ